MIFLVNIVLIRLNPPFQKGLSFILFETITFAKSGKTRRRRNSVETWEWMDIIVLTRFHQSFNFEVDYHLVLNK